jgi:hypothetical protein
VRARIKNARATERFPTPDKRSPLPYCRALLTVFRCLSDRQRPNQSRRAAHLSALQIVKRAIEHAFRNVGQQPGRLLVLNSPGKVHEGFFSQAGDAMPAGATALPPPVGNPDVPRVVEVGKRNGLEFLLDGDAH